MIENVAYFPKQKPVRSFGLLCILALNLLPRGKTASLLQLFVHYSREAGLTDCESY